MRTELKRLIITAALFTLAGSLLNPLYGVFVEQIGGDLLTAGSSYALFAITTGVLMFLLSRWEDKVKHEERLVVIGNILITISYVGYMYVKTPIHLFIIQAICGVGVAILSPAWDSFFAMKVNAKKAWLNGVSGNRHSS